MYGANKSLFQLMIELRDLKRVKVCALLPNYGEFADLLKNNNIEYIISKYYPFKTQKRDFKSYIKTFLNLFLYVIAYFRTKKFHYDIIHSNSSIIDIGAFFHFISKKTHIWHLREFGVLDYGLKPFFGIHYEKFIYNHGADCFIAISKIIKTYYERIINNSDIELIYNGVKEKKLDLSTKKVHNPIRFCILGLISKNKNQFQILEAINLLKKKFSENVFHCDFFGDVIDKKENERFINYIRDNKISKYITLHGYINNIVDKIDGFDVGLITSKSEAFGRVTVEYMMSGLAVIATDTGANLEIIEDGNTGLLYGIENSKNLADKISQLIIEKNLIHQLSLNGYSQAKKEYTSIDNTNKIFLLYQKYL